MKNIKSIIISLVLIFSFFSNLYITKATEISDSYLENQNFSDIQKAKSLTVKGLFIFYFNSIGEGIPESYKYIDLKFYDVIAGTQIYTALQKGVYLDLINNKSMNLNLDKLASQDLFAKMVKDNFDLDLIYSKNTPLKLSYFLQAMDEIKNYSLEEESPTNIQENYEIEKISNFPILNDVYYKLKNQHYDSNKLNDEELIRSAIKGMTEGTGDKYTTYFPPIDAKSFNDQLSGEFEGIGANVEMDKPGIMKIISPLPGSPAEKAGLKSGDQIIKIDSFEVTDQVTLQEAVNKIKGPAGTQVKLTVLRDGKNIEIMVTRQKIIIKYVESSKLNNGDNYIKITTFGVGTAKAFSGAVGDIIKNNPNGKTIIDLRNDPGGSLDEVASILNFFVPKGESVVNIKYKDFSTDMNSTGMDSFTFVGKNVVILVNKGSASASEIMAGTIRDYLGNTVRIIGETSYGKGSVQSLDNYSDGSSFKYTVAKWFTGKTKTGIDGVGIKPDIEIKLDETKFNIGVDNQLDYAKNYRF
ncbi:MAG: S41 family peptidase [Candidatus Gracilibacteria bacterium]|nr:S41 family peptidase [Candidatus Gracilibacteria bacterium]MDD2908326.1 S41 family peptidase [Candidatus Gracilibacteria bacterium]